MIAKIGKNTTETRTYKHHQTEINFFHEDQSETRSPKLTATIDTTNLHMRSVNQNDYADYFSMYSSHDVMKTYASGLTWLSSEVSDHIKNSVRVQNINSPYGSDLAVFERNKDDLFIGRTTLHPVNKPGVGELDYIYNKSFWSKGYGTEVAKAIVQEYAPATKAEGYLIDGAPLTKVEATALKTNIPSCTILHNKLGMKPVETLVRYGGERFLFELTLPDHPTFAPNPKL